MTRKQVKKQIEKIRELMLELKDEIEPYEGKEELTEQQEERKEWLENCQYELETALDNLEEYEY